MLTSLRHVGRSAFLAEEKRSGVWRVTRPGEVSLTDLSGSSLVQNLSEIPLPSGNPFALVTPSSGVETPLRDELEQKVLSYSSLADGGCLWASSGSDAVEIAAWAADLYALQNSGSAIRSFLVRRGGYHGNTYLTRFLSTRGAVERRERRDGQSLVVLEEEPAAPGSNPLLRALERAEGEGRIEHPAALIVEPLPTTGRNFFIGEEAYGEVAGWCRERGVMTIFDEIASGAYRHGRFNAFSWAAGPGRAPDMSLISKGLTCGAFPLSCVVFDARLTSFLRGRGAKPLTFTHALSDPAAWFALACLERYKEVFAGPDYGRRRRLIDELARGAAGRVPPGVSVEHSETTIRLSMPAASADAALASMEVSGLWAYCGYTEFPGAEGRERRGFIHLCPPFDLPAEEVESKLRLALKLILRAAG